MASLLTRVLLACALVCLIAAPAAADLAAFTGKHLRLDFVQRRDSRVPHGRCYVRHGVEPGW